MHPVAAEWDDVADLPAVDRLGTMYVNATNGRPLNAAILAQTTW